MALKRYSSWMLERVAIGDTVRLRFGTSTIGRHSTSNIRVLEAGFVSRHHAIFEVDDNDESVTIKDVSSNGLFINEKRYDKAVIPLKKDDLIGFGVSPVNLEDGVDVTSLPIYKLKYAPLRSFQAPNVAKLSTTQTTSSKPAVEVNGDGNNTNFINKESHNNGIGEDKKTAVKKEILINSDEIFEISDDDENDVTENTHLKSNENHKALITSLNKQIDDVIKSEPSTDEKDTINPSQKTQEKETNGILNENKVISTAEKSHTELSKPKDENVEKPTTSSNFSNTKESEESKEPILHVPIISNIKKERIRSVSNDIKNIFGDIDDDIDMQKAIKQINPLVYNEISESKNIQLLDDQEKLLTNGTMINLTEDEDLEEVEVEELGTIIPNIIETKEKINTIMKECKKELEFNKLSTMTPNATEAKEKDVTTMDQPKSPNLFDSSMDTSKEEPNAVEENEDNKDKQTIDTTDNIDLDEYTKYVPHSDDEDVEDLMFSQVIFNDMKAELQDDLNSEENLPVTINKNNNQIPSSVDIAGTTVNIKQEPGLELFAQVPKELENSCWIISDDEDYDKELETKVNDWSNKIFSQNLSLMSQNMSQVYEMDESDKNEEDDDWEDDNLSLLEDDLDGIAQIYNSIDETLVDKTTKATTDETEQPSNELSTKSSVKVNDTNELEDNKIKQEQLDSLEVEHKKKEQLESVKVEQTKVEELKLQTLIETKEKSPVNEKDDCTSETQSPIIRSRRLSKVNPISESSTSSEDELEIENNKMSNRITVPDKPIPKLHPPVIEAPSLPKHKGKLRGVSADLHQKTPITSKASSINKTLNMTREKILHERLNNDLKRKWLEKPSVSKRRDRERKKFIQECRKDKLKELAERKKIPTKDNVKRKLSTEGHEQKAKVAKVKVTEHNRGAFLANNEPTPPSAAAFAQNNKTEQKNQFKIPKITKKPDETKKPHNEHHEKKEPLTRSLSMDGFETFSQQITKPDELLHKRQNNETKKCEKTQPNNISKTQPTPLRRNSITEATLKRPNQTIHERKKTPPPPPNAISKESIAKRAVRTTNKITFASMEKNIIESEENKRKLSELNATTLKSINKETSTTKTVAKKKTVRFNDTPVIHYIERVTGAWKKINDKDVKTCMSTYVNRRHSVRNEYSIVDNTDKIITDILNWSNEWLKKRNAKVDAAGDVIFPMPTQFTSFEHYQSIIFPLMKLEFVSTLEREYNETRCLKNFKVSLEYSTLNESRIMLITKLSSNQSKELLDSTSYDLVLLEPDKRGPQIFAYVVANRKGAGSFTTIVYEIVAKNFTTEYFKAIKEFTVRPVMDRVRVHFGAFNSIYQLKSTPLFQKIINPLELLKCKPPPKKKVIYRGFDQLNEKQKQVLLNTYVKITDESTPNITLIQGPPGTGKSLVITNLVLQSLYGDDVRYLDKKFLICAQSNAAVDVIALKLFDISMRMRAEKRFRLVRFGMLNKIHPSVQPISLQKVVERDQLKKLQARNNNLHLENKENLKHQILQFETQIAEMSSRNIKGTVEQDELIEKKRQLQLMRNILNENMRTEDERSLYSWYLTNANIICATLSSCVNLSQYIDFFDICIIDEATQCTEPWTLLPLKFGINSLVLVGDTQQLPATVLSKKANELGLGTSMFTRIQRCLDSIPSTSVKGVTTPNSIINSLQTQYRMHPDICRWPNQYFYRNELINAKQTMDIYKSPLVPFCILSLSYTQNSAGVNGKITNNLEAEFVAKLLKALDGFIPNNYNTYGVITPYAHHRATLESAIRILGLTNIMVNTIDSYQGLEKDVIVISNARTSGIGFLSNPQRLNVALTRAKKCLILCGNFRNLESVPAWRCLLESARERRLYHEIAANCIEDIKTNVIDKIMLTSQNQ